MLGCWESLLGGGGISAEFQRKGGTGHDEDEEMTGGAKGQKAEKL